VGLLAAREGVLAAMARVFVQAIFRGQRERLGSSVQGGAVVFVQRCTNTLPVYPHLHVLALDGGYTEGDDGALEFHGDPGPSAEAREALEDEVDTRLSGWPGRRGYLDETPEPRPDDGGWLSGAQESSGGLWRRAAAAAQSFRGEHARAGVMNQRLLARADGRGRLLVYGLLVGTPAVASMIRDNKLAQLTSAMQSSRKDGMVVMDDLIRDAYLRAEIGQDEALSNMSDPRGLVARVTGAKLP